MADPKSIPATAPVIPDTTPAVATLVDNTNGQSYSFPFNINTLQFSYQMNQQSYNTIGGRVTQLLSVRLNTMQLDGDAGNRKNLLTMYENFKKVQDNQNQAKIAMTLNIPSRALQWNVFLQQMQMGFDITTITYPYNMSFEVNQEMSASSTFDDSIVTNALNNIAQGVGFNTTYLGLTTTTANVKYSDLLSAIDSGFLGKQ